MTVGFSTIDDAIRTAVLACVSGITEDVHWDWEPAQLRTGARVRLSRGPVEVIGRDGSHFEDETTELHEYRLGQRAFRVEVRAETTLGSPRASNAAPVSADDILARVVTRLRRRANVEALYAAGCAITDFAGIVRTTYSADGVRDVRAAITTVGFLCADVDQETGEGADPGSDWIEDVEGEALGEPFVAP